MEENEIQSSTNDSSMEVTEKRVTRTVIRRRARPSSETSSDVKETSAKAETKELEEEPKIEKASLETKVQAPEKTKKTKKTKSEAKAAPTGLRRVEVQSELKAPRVVMSAPKKEPEKQPVEEETQDDRYSQKFKRLKVVTAAEPEIRTAPTIVTPAPRRVEYTPAPLGRKEVIEIRDHHRPKAGRKKRILAPGKKGKKTEITTPKAQKRIIRISESVTVGDLSKKMSVKVNEVIQKLMHMGMMVTINQNLDLDTAALVASEFQYEIENVALQEEDILAKDLSRGTELAEDMEVRAPVVTVMGHVDHGKTSLLDAIRKTNVAAKESGGITQHIGASVIKTDSGRLITFVDTPGHEAFTEMRARGASVTDIVILVVAADDGVMPQTKEAVNHAKAAKVPIIVAVNKMDKEGADPERIKKELTEFEMVPEEWGGETIFCPVSAKTGQGIDQLLEMILLQADVLELKANPKGQMEGTVIEARLDKKRGAVMTILVQKGTLHEGDTVVVGQHFGRIRAMHDDKGRRIKEAAPSTPVELLGIPGVAKAGDVVIGLRDERKAKQIAELRQKKAREQDLAKTSKVSLDDLYLQIEQGEMKELKIIVKADAAGSVEALTDNLHKLSTAKVAVKVIHGAVGGITESDVMLASASGAIIVGFHVRPDGTAMKVAEKEGVDIRLYEVIYELTEDVEKAMKGLLAPQVVEKILGRLEVREIFTISKVGTIAGCMVVDGKIQRNSKVRVIRDHVPVYKSSLVSLKRFKDDVKEVVTGQDCGLSIENFNDIKVGDVIEAFSEEQIAASLT